MRYTIRSIVASCLVVGTICFAAGWGLNETSYVKPAFYFPKVDPSVANGCQVEENAYNAAAATAEAASSNAADAYDAWYECQNSSMVPNVGLPNSL